MKVTVTVELGKHKKSMSSENDVTYGDFHNMLKCIGELAMSYLIAEIEAVQNGTIEFPQE